MVKTPACVAMVYGEFTKSTSAWSVSCAFIIKWNILLVRENDGISQKFMEMTPSKIAWDVTKFEIL